MGEEFVAEGLDEVGDLDVFDCGAGVFPGVGDDEVAGEDADDLVEFLVEIGDDFLLDEVDFGERFVADAVLHVLHLVDEFALVFGHHFGEEVAQVEQVGLAGGEEGVAFLGFGDLEFLAVVVEVVVDEIVDFGLVGQEEAQKVDDVDDGVELGPGVLDVVVKVEGVFFDQEGVEVLVDLALAVVKVEEQGVGGIAVDKEFEGEEFVLFAGGGGFLDDFLDVDGEILVGVVKGQNVKIGVIFEALLLIAGF